jgi:hypothetical protein
MLSTIYLLVFIETLYIHPGRPEYTQRLEELPVLEPHHQAYFTPDFAAI